MRIERFEYADKAQGWELSPIEFSDLTLLVGVSGVGKTLILNALLDMKRIAGGVSSNGVAWDISFRTAKDLRYRWQGEFGLNERPSYLDKDVGNGSAGLDEPRILSETLTRDDGTVATRTVEEIRLEKKLMPKLSPHSSLLSTLSHEDALAPASAAFKQMRHSHQDSDLIEFAIPGFPDFDELLTKYDSPEKIQSSGLATGIKLGLVYRTVPGIFREIAECFVDIFPSVTRIRVEPLDGKQPPFSITKGPIVQIQERGATNWIPQWRISSGMLKTLLHLAEMYLNPPGTVILIDEFENSLGVNCIHALTEDLLRKDRGLQFVVTSHHPYIINNIAPKHWKVVRRDGGRVWTLDAAALGLGRSHHEAFIQLINHDDYCEGIEAG